MSGHFDNIETIAAQARNEYGVELQPFQNVHHRLCTWLSGWRSAPSIETKRFWVHNFVAVAAIALKSGLLAAEEFPLVFHEVLFLHSWGQKDLSPENEAAWEEVYARLDWRYEYVPGCGCVNCARSAVGLPTPDNSPKQGPAPVVVSPPGEQLKRGRGRPKGTADIAPRAIRGSQVGLTKAQRSKISREGAKRRKELLEQQRQQTPPA